MESKTIMKICYGVQGTGNGHIARARIMAQAFALRDDVTVDFYFSGRDADAYFDMEVFGEYRTFRGLTFFTHKGRVDPWKTVSQNSPIQAYRDIKQLDLSQYDLVLNDFEPITAWTAKRQGIKSISISHQAAFQYPVPQSEKGFIDQLIMKYFAPCDMSLGVHWYHFGSPIIPPFIHEEPIIRPNRESVVVYLPFEDLAEVIDVLQPISEQDFVVFHPDIKEASKQANVSLQPLSKPNFKYALQHCAGVIGNGGFELSSESLRLGKKLLLKPLEGQFEQSSNIVTLKALGLCEDMGILSSETIEDWLSLKDNPIIAYPKTPEVLVNWLLAQDYNDTQTLCQALWKQVTFPADVLKRARELIY